MSGGGLIVLGGLALLIAGGIAALRSVDRLQANRKQLDGRLTQLRADEPDGAIQGGKGALSLDLPQWLTLALARADIVPRTDTVLLLGAAILLAAAILYLAFGWIAGLGGLVAMVGGGVVYLRFIAARRIAKFVDGLPFFFDTIRQMLMTGNSVQQALARATENTNPIMRRYLVPMVRRTQNGASVAESAVWLAERLDVLELHMFATAIQTNIRYGGRLSAVLSNLVSVLRDRARVIRELTAATAETRMSAIILSCLPVGVGAFIFMTSPGYVNFFFATSQGHHMLALAIGLQIFGMLIMRWLLRLDY